VLGTVLTKTDDGERIAQRTAASLHGLAPDVRERTVVVGESYIIAAYVDGFSTRYDLPAAYSPSRSYGYFPEPTDEKDAALFVGSDPEELRPYFGHVRKIGDVTSDLGAFLLTDRRQPWSVIWPRMRNLTVS
jgi:hypothetical protein